jgi:hypothetical protein
MRWWVKAQQLPWVLLAALIGSLLSIFASDVALPIPSLSGPTAFSAIRSFALIAVLMAIATWTGATFGHKAPVLASVRRTDVFGFLAVGGVVALSAVVVTAAQLISSEIAEPGWLMVRDLLGFLSLGIVLLPWTGYRYAGIVPTVYVFGAAIFGREATAAGEQTALWAWPISASESLLYWLPALLLAFLALVVTTLRSHTASSRIVISQALDTRRE